MLVYKNNSSLIWTYEEQSKPGNPQHVYVASSGVETSTVCIEEY